MWMGVLCPRPVCNTRRSRRLGHCVTRRTAICRHGPSQATGTLGRSGLCHTVVQWELPLKIGACKWPGCVQHDDPGAQHDT